MKTWKVTHLQLSLGSTLGGGEHLGEATSGETELLCQLMNAISRHSPEEDPQEFQRFQECITAEADRLKAATDQAGRKLAVEAVIALVAQHNAAAKTYQKARAAELTQALRMMTDTIGQVGQSSQAAVHQLGLIEKGIEEATATNDITRFRMKLGVCLKMIREQSESLKVQTHQHLEQLKAFVVTASVGQDSQLLDEPLDSLTGLPARCFAESLIKQRFERRTDCLVGLVSMNRMKSFKARFGQEAMDDVVKTMARLLAQRLPVETTLCRWSDFSFVAVTDITSSYAEMSQQWRKVGGLKVEKHIENGNKAAFVSVNTSILLEHVRPLSSRRELIQNLDRFVAQQCGEIVV